MNNLFEGGKYKLIYVFRINDKPHEGCLKVGETTVGEDVSDINALRPNDKLLNKYARKRINQYTGTAGIEYDLLYTEAAVRVQKGVLHSFGDRDVHDVLRNSGIHRKEFGPEKHKSKEWFETDLATVKKAIAAVKAGRTTLSRGEITTKKSPIEFRPEQKEAIKRTIERFQKGNQMLWNAKMRFGKTLTALEVVKELDIARTLILTHRPVVNSGWYDDFGKIFYDREDYIYGSQKGRKPGTSPDKHFAAYAKEYKDNGTHIVWFASLQDLRGSKDVGGGYDKNHYLFAMDWDLLIIDEAHEGTKTELGGAVIEMLSKENTKVLRLSGTPYNIIDGYSAEEIYTWDYTMEQRAKLAWDEEHLGEHNPYASLPRMNIYTYDLGRLITQYDEGEIAFNFHEFFLTDAGGGFVHHADVKRFLDLLVLPDETGAYPFSNERYRSIFRHTLWVLPGVKAARALDVMLRHHPVFGCFEIVNVAGESRNSEGEERGDALERVTKAIGGDACATRTITLTCGRLTTGVTVGAWTGVLMLAGGYNTSLASYMQTIFRVQSSCEFGGKTKEDCYVFDFAPDRTLRVIADAAKANTKAGKTTDTQRAELGKLLNFCPVIAIKGSGMTELKADELLRRVKRAYIERVVRSGFEDGYLYNDELLKLSDIEIKEFANLKGIIGQTKAIGSSGDIDINRQGLTNEEYEELERISKKKKSELTEEEKKRKEEHRQKQQLRKEAISILRGISIRMPLLIYGADIADEEAELTIDNFTSLVDDSSWEEFMPAGVSKDYFKQFLKYYDADIFSAAGKRIRALAREADKMSIEERIQRITEIFSLFRNPDKETVLTPWRVVNMHLADALGGYAFYDKEYAQTIDDPRYVDRGRISDEVFAPNSAVLEINSKSGLYPLYMTYTIYRRRIKDLTTAPVTHEDHLRIWDETLRENIFVVCKTPMAKSITRRTLAGFRTEAKVNMHYFEDLINQIKNKQDAFLAKVKQGKTYWKANDNNDMKFSVVVGNPPYQEEGDSNRREPVYHLFYQVAFRLAGRATLITPARFLFNVGQTPKDWTERMLNDPHIKVVDYFKDSSDVFPTVDIKGGVAVLLRDETQNFGAIEFFSEYGELRTILQKVSSHKDFTKGAFSDIVSSQGIYKFTELAFTDYPRVKEVQGKGTGVKITSNVLENLTELFLTNDPKDKDKYIQIIGRANSQRVTRWIKQIYIKPVKSLDYYKVIVAGANGTGAFGETLSTPFIGTPGMGHTDTFISIGKFKTEIEAANCLKYIQSKFARTMLGTLKVTQNGPSSVYANVPLQDFTLNSDIRWTQSIESIDVQLYDKYGLDSSERSFVETHVKPMK